MVWQIQRRGDDQEGEQEEEDRVYIFRVSIFGRRCSCENALNINFSVDVNMYSENVTSYWYRLRWNQRSRAAGYSMAARTRADAQASRVRVARYVESIMNALGGCVCVARAWESRSGGFGGRGSGTGAHVRHNLGTGRDQAASGMFRRRRRWGWDVTGWQRHFHHDI